MFDWIPIYKEIAQKLIAFKSNRKGLVNLLEKMRRAELSVISVDDFEDQQQENKITLEEIDPFTFMANYNRGVGTVKRKEILKFLKEEWKLDSDIPTGFDGIPVVTNMKTWFFAFKYDRKPEDIDLLWSLFENALQYSISEIDEELFNACLNIKGVRANLTMGLYWLNPEKFMPLDTNSRTYLKKHFNFDKVGIVKLKYNGYNKLLSDIHQRTDKTFYELSQAAWEGVHLNGGNEDGGDEVAPKLNKPLNQILYGPPGTGKTYNTKNIALEILGEDIATISREQVIEVYDKYSKEGRIEFVTFHQSFGYEDFIEGIKPVLTTEDETTDLKSQSDIRYEIAEGVFKKIANKASTAKTKSTKTDELFIDKSKFENVKYFKMSLGNTLQSEDDEIYQYCLKNNVIALGWGGDVNFEKTESVDDIKSAYRNAGYEIKSNNDFSVSAVKMFLFWMKKGDIVFISNGNRKLRAVAKIKSDYIFREDTPISYHQFREVEWLLTDIDILTKSFYYTNFSQQAIYQMYEDRVDNSIFTKAMQENSEVDNYVLVIDEINRGNIASIFGELITLIEDDKREGALEELSAVLPYSKEKFRVPDNLFIIGTMNTADRSVEALDTALRRRFNFIEMTPDYELITPQRLIAELWVKYANTENWDDEPYRTHADNLYGLIGADFEEDDIWQVYWKDDISPNELASAFDDLDYTGLNPSNLLKAINDRIEVLLDKDHCIGHSYFMKLLNSTDSFTCLQEIFSQNILPLLNEYFYGDPSKIGMILGPTFIKKKEKNNIWYHTGFNSDYEDATEKDTFEIIIPDNLEDFKKIYEK